MHGRLLVLGILGIISATSFLPSSSFWVQPTREPFPLRASKVPVDDFGLSKIGSSSSLVATATAASTTIHEEPTSSADIVTILDNPTKSGSPLVFQVLNEKNGWLKVKLPIRPNGSTGWIPNSSAELNVNHFRVRIDTTNHKLRVVYKSETRLQTPIATGNGETPTPIGSFYLTELLQPEDPNGIYGPFAFGLSGFSETLLSFNGGDGVIGLHGTNDPASLGKDVSHGCIRLHNDTISELASFLPLGTPVEIVA